VTQTSWDGNGQLAATALLIVLALYGCSSSSTSSTGTSNDSVNTTQFRLSEARFDRENDAVAEILHPVAYDAQGTLSSTTVTDLTTGLPFSRITYENDGNDVIQSRTDDGIDETIDSAINYSYDTTGRLLTIMNDDQNDGIIDSSSTRLYEANELSTGQAYDNDNDGTVDAISTHFYDVDGNRVREEIDEPEGIPDVAYIYEFDANGQLLTQSIDTGVDGSIEQLWTYVYEEGPCNAELELPVPGYQCVTTPIEN